MTPEVHEITLSYMEGLDCARSLTVAILLRHSEWGQLFSLETVPSDYSSPESYRASACASDFLRKLDDPSLTGLDLEQLAIEKWIWAEKECFRSNRRFNEIYDFGTLNGLPVADGIASFLRRVEKNLLLLIGSGPDELHLNGAFGPGATVSDRSTRVSVLDKLSSTPTLTSSAAFYLVPWVGTKWGSACARRGDDPAFVRGNQFFTVPKTSQARRACAKEPSVNVFYQLALGRAMRKRLKRHGIDLDHGQDTHRQVACSSSRDGRFCTIDLSSASDTVCESLVRNTLPRGWYHHLSDLRSGFTSLPGGEGRTSGWHRLEKFSSMGNGFTFELETALFCAICMSVMTDPLPGVNLWVYGDDIIVPSEISREVISALRFCGFTPNKRKTFTEGEFRESCGGDFFRGKPVRAHYLKEYPNEPQDFISLANGVRRVIEAFEGDNHRRAGLLRAWFRVLDFIPSNIRSCRGPQELGDLVIHDDESRWVYRWRRKVSRRWIRVYRPASFKGVRFGRFHPDVQEAAALYGIFLTRTSRKRPPVEFDDSRMLVIRDGVTGYKVGWLPYS